MIYQGNMGDCIYAQIWENQMEKRTENEMGIYIYMYIKYILCVCAKGYIRGTDYMSYSLHSLKGRNRGEYIGKY